MEVCPGPDFPTAGLILGTKGIARLITPGAASVIMQARATIEPMDSGRQAIIVTELPYQVNKATLIENIAALAPRKESRRHQRIARRKRPHRNAHRDRTEARSQPERGAELPLQAHRAAHQLWHHQPVDRRRAAESADLKESLEVFIEHRQEVIRAAANFN